MRFVARHVSLTQIEGATVFALGDQLGRSGESPPQSYAILQFGEEDDQDRALGLTGLHIESSQDGPRGYGAVEGIDFDGRTVSIRCGQGREIHATIETDMMNEDAIRAAVELCNLANVRGSDGETNL